MRDTSWALVREAGAPKVHVAAAIIDHVRHGAATDASELYAQWGAFVTGLAPRAAFAATADNVSLLDGELRLASDLREGVEPLDVDATAARLCWHLARSLVLAGVADDPDITVDLLATRVGGRSGLQFDTAARARAKAHEASFAAVIDNRDPGIERGLLDEEGNWSMRDALAAGAIADDDSRFALAVAWDSLVNLRADRDRAEAAAIEVAATRALAQSLGEELERDEWIRARLRKAKATKAANLAIAARKRILRRP